MGVRKKWLIKVGGFSDKFKRAWYEDTFLGAQLIASGLKIIPIKNITGYHIVVSNNKKRKYDIDLINRNRLIYSRLISKPLKETNRKNFEEKIKKYGRYIKKIS